MTYYPPHMIDAIRRSSALDTLCVHRHNSAHGGRYRCGCPVCGGWNNAVLFNGRDSRMLRCYDCDFKGDIVAIYARQHGVTRNQAIQAVLRDFADRLDNLPAAPQQPPKRASPTDFSAYVRCCKDNLATGGVGWQYLHWQRGFDPDDIRFLRDEYHIGYDGNCTGHGSLEAGIPAIILPYMDSKGHCYYYRARAIDTTSSIRFTSPQGATSTIFMPDQLDTTEHCFVVESELDCLSILISQRHVMPRHIIGCIATGGQGNIQPLIKRLESPIKAACLYCLPDNDMTLKKGYDNLFEAVSDKLDNICILNPRLTLGRYRDRDNNPLKDCNDILKRHGPKALAGMIDACVQYPHLFSTSMKLTKTHKGNDD